MPVAVNKRPRFFNMEEVLRNLGSIPPSRVRMDPAPGTATLRDLIRLWKAEGKMCELVDGTLVEKPMGFAESNIATRIAGAIESFADEHDLGVVVGEQGLMKLVKGLVRAPDVSFVSWDQLPERCLPDESVPDVFPNFAVEVLSKGNTPREMARKRREYFRAGTSLVWMVYPKTRTVDVYINPDEFETRTIEDVLDGGEVLPGFRLSVQKIFAKLSGQNSKRPRTNGR